ncbi:MAG: hypothetical protein ACRDMJ_09290 [Solirubrobacteraceae bacterium]
MLAVIAWRIVRRLLLAGIVVVLLLAAMHALRTPRPYHARHRQTTLEQLLGPVQREIGRAIRTTRSR